MKALEFTGERMTTDYRSYGSVEHLHRYSVVLDLLRNEMTVLDIACGEGYGTKLISGKVNRVIGVDISTDAVAHASAKYSDSNIEFIQASALDIPLEDNSIDLIVSFETLEHLKEQDRMLSELKRVLKKEGILVLSTPDRNNYSKGIPNPFHVKELSFDEFKDLMGRYFKHTCFFFQKTVHGSFIYNDETPSFMGYYEGDFDRIDRLNAVDKPDFIMAVSSDSAGNIPVLNRSLFDASSIFDREYRDYLETKERYHKIVGSKRFRNLNRFLKIFGLGFRLSSVNQAE